VRGTRGRVEPAHFLTRSTRLTRINKPLYKCVLKRTAAAGPVASQPEEPSLSPSPARIRGTLASIVDQPDDLRELRTFHRALADVNRLRIVRRLAETPSTVTELIDHVGLSQPLVSHHLKRLRDAGLVVTRRAGRETICSLRPGAFDEVAARERDVLGYAPPIAG
jgi:DNA-binding transcriptional ArsR family regulator